MGCRSCELACKEEHDLRGIEVLAIGPKKGIFVPVFTEECNSCEDRVSKGLDPTCIMACPYNARCACAEHEITSRISNKNRLYAMSK